MVKLAVIGTGGIAKKAYFPLLARMPEIEVIAVFSKTLQHAEDAASRWRIPFATNIIEDIVSQKPDATLVISSTGSHFKIIQYLLENNIDVYSEKSLTTLSKQSYELDELARKNECILTVGFNRRYALLYKQAKEMIGSRKINLAIIQKHRTNASNPSLFQHYLDDTIHQIDLMRFYCGDVQAVHTNYQMQNGNLTSAISTVNLPGDGQGIITICNQAGAWQESVTLHADGISVHIDAFRQLRVMENDHETVYGADRAGNWITSLHERGFYGEISHFLSCVKTRAKPQTNAFEAAKTQELLEDLVRVAGDEILS